MGLPLSWGAGEAAVARRRTVPIVAPGPGPGGEPSACARREGTLVKPIDWGAMWKPQPNPADVALRAAIIYPFAPAPFRDAPA